MAVGEFDEDHLMEVGAFASGDGPTVGEAQANDPELHLHMAIKRGMARGSNKIAPSVAASRLRAGASCGAGSDQLVETAKLAVRLNYSS